MKYLRLVSLKENALTNIIMQWEIDKYASKKELLETAYTKIDLLLDCFEKETLLSQLNDMQIEVFGATNGKKEKCGCFESKYTIPFHFVNLILKEYNLKIIYED